MPMMATMVMQHTSEGRACDGDGDDVCISEKTPALPQQIMATLAAQAKGMSRPIHFGLSAPQSLSP